MLRPPPQHTHTYIPTVHNTDDGVELLCVLLQHETAHTCASVTSVTLTPVRTLMPVAVKFSRAFWANLNTRNRRLDLVEWLCASYKTCHIHHVHVAFCQLQGMPSSFKGLLSKPARVGRHANITAKVSVLCLSTSPQIHLPIQSLICTANRNQTAQVHIHLASNSLPTDDACLIGSALTWHRTV